MFWKSWVPTGFPFVIPLYQAEGAIVASERKSLVAY